ncbi:MAG TPA: hypothetical protein DCY20_01245 [Firmicutes bacterium]|nr:hypothetical protein [Bacillota bacterium]
MNDRGMMKWQPFASITEQSGAIYDLLNDLSKIEKPILDEWQHEENARKLLSAHLNEETIILTYYQKGQLHDQKGRVYKINEPYRYIMFNYLNSQCLKISFDNIIRVN